MPPICLNKKCAETSLTFHDACVVIDGLEMPKENVFCWRIEVIVG